MHFARYVCLLPVLLMSLTGAPALAKEVTQSYKGLTLDANLELAPGRKLTDGVVLITHGALAHRGMELIQTLQRLLQDKGYNTLAINLSLGIDNRHGMYDCSVTHRHRNQDAANEIDAWVQWLKHQGVARVTVLGHSRGGAQTALYAAEHHDAAVKAVVLMAPATGDNTSPTEYQKRYGKPLAPVLKSARELIQQGKPDAVLEHVGLMGCRDTSATAASFVSYYGKSPDLDTPSLLPRITQPALVVVAGADEVVVGLDKKVAPLADGKHIRMKVIDMSGHFFRDLNAEDAVDAIDGFLRSI